jgi:hypothetical protein
MDFNEINNFMGMGGSGNFLKLELDKVYKFILLSIKPKEGKFGKTLEYTVLYEGEEKKFSSGAKRLLFGIQNAKIKENDIFLLKKSGEGYKTQFSIQKYDGDMQKIAEKEIDIDDINL